jgi:hypothetical protein
MEFNQIRYFAALADSLHFTKAAEACNVSQPALTRAIQKLEEELGGPLFHRERANTQLTELGQQMRAPLQRALAAAREAKSLADAFRRRDIWPLRIGLELSIPPGVLTPVIQAVSVRNEGVELTLRPGSREALCEQIFAGELDMALLVDRPELPERLHRWQLYAERYMVLCRPGHRFAALDAVTPEQLAEEALLLLTDDACPVRSYMAALWQQSGLRPRRQHFGGSAEQLMEMVQAALGVSVCGERQAAGGSVVQRPVAAEPGQRAVVLAIAAGRQLGPTPALFLKLLRARAWGQAAGAAGAQAA